MDYGVRKNLKVEMNVLCCLISTAAMLQQAARVRVDRWKRIEGRPQGFPHSHACRHSSTAHDLQIIKVHTLFDIIRAKLSSKRPTEILQPFTCLHTPSRMWIWFGSKTFWGVSDPDPKNRSDQLNLKTV